MACSFCAKKCLFLWLFLVLLNQEEVIFSSGDLENVGQWASRRPHWPKQQNRHGTILKARALIRDRSPSGCFVGDLLVSVNIYIYMY